VIFEVLAEKKFAWWNVVFVGDIRVFVVFVRGKSW
jgi:hypothetical protein